jgi:hypothetical protein
MPDHIERTLRRLAANYLVVSLIVDIGPPAGQLAHEIIRLLGASEAIV